MQGNRDNIIDRTLVWPCTKNSRKKSWSKVTTLRNHHVQTDRNIRDNKPDIIIRDNENGTCLLMDVAISGENKRDQERSWEDYKINSAHVGCESKSDTGNNMGNWNHFKISQTIPEQHTGRARNYGTTKNSHIEHCTILRKVLM